METSDRYNDNGKKYDDDNDDEYSMGGGDISIYLLPVTSGGHTWW